MARRLTWRGWHVIHSSIIRHKRPGTVRPVLRYVLVQLTYNCNLRCWFCNQWGSSGVYKELPASELRKTLPLSVLKNMIDDLPLTCSGLSLWGGETLQYPDLIPLVRYIKASGMGCSLITNGTALAKSAAELVRSRVDVIHVSIDSTEKLHDEFRGAKGTYRAALDGIRAVRSQRPARNGSRPRIYVGCTLIPAAVGELKALISEVRAAGADYITINKVTYANAEIGQAHERTFNELFQIHPASWKGFQRSEELNGAQSVKTALDDLRADPANRGFVLFENAETWSPEDWRQYYTDPTYVAPREHACRFPWDSLCIFPNGDASPCPDFPDYVVGNVVQQRFRSIWNGERYKKFRATLADVGRFPICSICCHLYDD
jgi:radical SAM protein with 4Fe4S-binding SPASM domain